MYEDYWGLTNPPFQIQPDPRFLYPSTHHSACLSRLHEAVTDGATGILLSGEFGSGKTTLVRRLLHNLSGQQYRTAYASAAILTPVQTMQAILSQLSGEDSSRSTTLKSLSLEIQHLVLNLTRTGKGAVVVVDDIRSAKTRKLIDELLGLVTAASQAGSRLTVIAVDEIANGSAHGSAGASPSRARVNGGIGLGDYLSIHAELLPLDEEEIGNMLEYRMKQAWYIGNGRVFAADAVHEIHEYAGGNPKRSCEIADRALAAGMEQKARLIDGLFMRAVIMDVEGKEW
jgi:general secretion pathway protein A